MATNEWVQTNWTEPKNLAAPFAVTKITTPAPTFSKPVGTPLAPVTVEPPPINFYTWREVIGL